MSEKATRDKFKFIMAVCLHLICVSCIVLTRTYVDLLFLSNYPASWLPYFFFGTTAVIMLSAFCVTPLVSKGSNRASFVILVGMALSIVLSRVVLNFKITGLPFVISLWLTAASVLIGVISWNTVGDAFDVRKFKNLVKWINGAGCVGGLLMGLCIPFIISFASSDMLLYVLGSLVALSSFCVLALKPIPVLHKKIKEQVSLFKFPLFKCLFASVLILMVVDTFADYTLKSQVGAVFSKDEIGKFMGPFYGLASVLSLVVQFGGTGPLLKYFGVAFLLVVLPSFSILASIGIIVSPGLWLAAIFRMGENVFKYSLDNIGCEIVANPLPGKIRRKGKITLKGVAAPLGTCIGALVLWGIADRFGLRGVALVTIAACVIWLLTIFKINKAYQATLKDAIKLKRFGTQGSQITEADILAAGKLALSAIREKDPETIRFGLKVLENLSTKRLPEDALMLIDSENKDIRAAVAMTAGRVKDKYAALSLVKRLDMETDNEVLWRILEALSIIEPNPAILKSTELLKSSVPNIRAGAILVLLAAGDLDALIEAGTALREMVYSPDPDMREGAARAIGTFKAGKLEKELKTLLGDTSEKVCIAAIRSINLRKTISLTEDLVLKLGSGKVSHYASRTLTGFGLPAIESLEKAVLQERHSRSRAAIRTLALIEDPEAEKVLSTAAGSNFTTIKTFLAEESALRARRQSVSHEFKTRAHDFALDEFKTIRILLSVKNHHSLSEYAKSEIHARQQIHKKNYLCWFSVCTASSDVPDIAKILLSETTSPAELSRQATALELLDTLAPDKELKQTISIFENKHLSSAQNALEKLEKLEDPWLKKIILTKDVDFNGGQMDITQKVILLRKTTLFRNLPSEILLIIAEEVMIREMVMDEKIFSQGDSPDGLYIVATGTVIIRKGDVVISKLGEGGFFGEIGLFDNSPRMADAIAETNGSLLVIDNETFNSITQDLPEILREVAKTVIGYLRRQRNSVRVDPSINEPVSLLVEQARYQMKNISTGGFCIPFNKEFERLKTGKRYTCSISLPEHTVDTFVRILDISEDAYHCELVDLSKKDRDEIHLYILNRQKEDLML
ncbi:MAG: cyclic nucleotide-binding domain-containing protein [Desulfobacterales bacterium]|nr:cyclic nucleotide-binding domain-containing protein [Desulfobacterales bacterium]